MEPTFPEFIDIHAHVNFEAYKDDRDAAVKRALDANTWMINVGTQKDTSKSAVELAEKYERGVYAAIGLHPTHTSKSYHDAKELGEGGREFTSRGEVFDTTIYRSMAAHPKVVAIGECGLDYYRENQDSGFKIQEKAFREQIELALEVDKPLMLHLRSGSGRSAYKDAFEILNSYFLIYNSKLRGDVHFFAGDVEEAKLFLDIGFMLSFTGVITFARDYDEVVKYAPLDRIMSETDCPYLTPVPHRGTRNEPLYVKEVAKQLALIRGESEEKVQTQIIENARLLFCF